jgi:hypothetical protein
MGRRQPVEVVTAHCFSGSSRRLMERNEEQGLPPPGFSTGGRVIIVPNDALPSERLGLNLWLWQ